jgi:thiol-disulfide isomerase/thioredoxin
MPGCKPLIKRKVRKAKNQIRVKVDGVDVLVDRDKTRVRILGFWGIGCAPCERAKVVLKQAKVEVEWLKADCTNRGMMQKYKITKVPTFVIIAGDVTVKTHRPETVIRFARAAP